MQFAETHINVYLLTNVVYDVCARALISFYENTKIWQTKYLLFDFSFLIPFSSS